MKDLDFTPITHNLKGLFYGKLNIEFACSLFYFKKNTIAQKIIHALKYQSNKKIGVEFGKLLGEKIKEQNCIGDIDYIIPIPIHHKRKYNRGYNQSEYIAKGISEIINKKISLTFLIKKKNRKSQTKNSAEKRWINTKNTFHVIKKKEIKHVLIVDDVITTGATIEDAVNTIMEGFPKIKISIVSLAVTKTD